MTAIPGDQVLVKPNGDFQKSWTGVIIKIQKGFFGDSFFIETGSGKKLKVVELNEEEFTVTARRIFRGK